MEPTNETEGPIEGAEIAPVEIAEVEPAVVPTEKTPVEIITPDIEPEVEGIDVAPATVVRSGAMTSEGGSVQETPFRTQ